MLKNIDYINETLGYFFYINQLTFLKIWLKKTCVYESEFHRDLKG